MKLSKLKLPEKVTNKAGIGLLKVKKASPEILLIGGFIFMGGAIVTAIRSARRHDEIISNHEEKLEIAKCEYDIPDEYEMTAQHETADNHVSAKLVKKTDKEISRQVRKVYFHTFLEFAKLYSSTITLAGLSALCFVSSHNIQARRITGLSGAYTSLREAFERYQQRNIELNGKENHEMCKYGWKEVDIEEVDPETGKVTTTKKKVPVYEGLTTEEMRKLPFHDQLHVYSKQTAYTYVGIPDADMTTLLCAQEYARNMLHIRGWVVVNDILDTLGMDRTPEGMYEGWVKGHGPEPDFNIEDSINNRFLAKYKHEDVYLDFNIHGNVYAILAKDEEEKALREEELKAKRLSEEGVTV